MNLFKNRFVGLQGKRGFTLLEMLISISIMTLITTVVLISFPKFSEMIYLHKGAQSIASSIRRAQVYGISVKENPSGSGQFPAYGLHFELGTSDSYVLFADNDDGKDYDAGELVRQYNVPKPGYVYDICWRIELPPSGACDIGGADIIFKRPVPDIYIYGTGAGPAGPFDNIEIIVRSPRGSEKKVIVWRSGQIAVE